MGLAASGCATSASTPRAAAATAAAACTAAVAMAETPAEAPAAALLASAAGAAATAAAPRGWLPPLPPLLLLAAAATAVVAAAIDVAKGLGAAWRAEPGWLSVPVLSLDRPLPRGLLGALLLTPAPVPVLRQPTWSECMHGQQHVHVHKCVRQAGRLASTNPQASVKPVA
jgi:hypothetical protein